MTIPTALAAPHSLDEQKRVMRSQAAVARAACNPALGAALSDHVLVAGIIPRGAVVAGFWPMPAEIDIRPLLAALARDHDLALPRTPRLGCNLSFHRWRPGDLLQAERFGTMAPQAPDGSEVTPTVLLVPLLAFDRRGHRLGYGGGYYDRTLAALPGALTIGCAFASQEVTDVPVGPTDISLSCIATERGVIRI